MTYPLDRKLTVEFVGMFMFVFTVAGLMVRVVGGHEANAQSPAPAGC